MAAINETGMRPDADEEFWGEITALAGKLLSRWKTILAAAVLFAAAGVVYGILAKSVYHSEAIISPKQSQGSGGSTGLLSQLGGMGGMVASQLGLGNTSFESLEIIARSSDLAKAMVQRHDLLPVLFPKEWDAAKKAWKNPSKPPTVRAGTDALQAMLAVEYDFKKRVIILGMNAPDSSLSADLLNLCILELYATIKEDVRRDADSNRAYLEQQLSITADPLLREKLQQMISMEIEKAMLVSTRPFSVLQSPVVPETRMKPKRKMIIILSFLLGAFLASAAILSSNQMERAFAALRAGMAGARNNRSEARHAR